MEMLKEHCKNEEEKAKDIDFEQLETFCFENHDKINRIITIGGDGTVVNAIKMFYKEK